MQKARWWQSLQKKCECSSEYIPTQEAGHRLIIRADIKTRRQNTSCVNFDLNELNGSGSEEDKEDKGRAEDKVVEAEKVLCEEEVRQAIGCHEVLPDDWRTTANVIRERGRLDSKEILIYTGQQGRKREMGRMFSRLQ